MLNLIEILSSKNPHLILYELSQSDPDGFSEELPELMALRGFEEMANQGHKDNFHHTLSVLKNVSDKTDNVWLRLVALCHDLGKSRAKRFNEKKGWTFHGHQVISVGMTKRIFDRFNLPKDKLDYVSTIVAMHHRPIGLDKNNITDSAIRRLEHESKGYIDDLLLFCECDITTKHEQKAKKYIESLRLVRLKIEEIKQKDSIRTYKMPITGHDIMKYFNIKEGRKVGIIYDKIKSALLNGEIKESEAFDYMAKLKSND